MQNKKQIFSFKLYYDSEYPTNIQKFRFDFKIGNTEIAYLYGSINNRCGNACISEIFVDKNFRREGIATVLIRKCLKEFGKDYDFELLACPLTNESMLTAEILKKIYEKFGFVYVYVSQENEIEIGYIMKRKKCEYEHSEEDNWNLIL